jgi:hypothetical protein
MKREGESNPSAIVFTRSSSLTIALEIVWGQVPEFCGKEAIGIRSLLKQIDNLRNFNVIVSSNGNGKILMKSTDIIDIVIVECEMRFVFITWKNEIEFFVNL